MTVKKSSNRNNISDEKADRSLIRDLEDEEALDEDEEGVTHKYEKAQRELVTQSVDFNIRTLADMVSSGQIDTNPKYQRRLRWEDTRKSKLIESFLMNVPIPPLFFAEESYGKYIVIDGQQRLRALAALFENELKLKGLEVFKEIEGKIFSELPSELQSVLSMRPTLRCIIIQRQSDPEIKFEVFERLNTGGVKLNAQEIRNSAYRGPLNNLIIELSENQKFRQMLKIKDPEKSLLVQYMRDGELVLRFLALKDTWKKFSGSMRLTLNRFMKENKEASRDQLSHFKNDFINTLSVVDDAFGKYAFLRWDPSRKNWSRHVLASVFDAQMFACYKCSVGTLSKHQTQILEEFKRLFEKDTNFSGSILGQTNTATKLVYRVKKVQTLIKRWAGK